MTLDDLRLHRNVQGILVRNYVNTQKLDVEVIGSSVYIEGEIEVFEYHSSMQGKDRVERDLAIARNLLIIEKHLRAMMEITHIEWKLTNWHRVGLQWTPQRQA